MYMTMWALDLVWFGDSSAQAHARAQGYKGEEIVTPCPTSEIYTDDLAYITNYVGNY